MGIDFTFLAFDGRRAIGFRTALDSIWASVRLSIRDALPE
jgi:hypothetical protein